MTGRRDPPLLASTPGPPEPYRGDPLLDSWLRRVRSTTTGNGLERLASAYRACSSSGVLDGPSADTMWSSVRAVAIMRRCLALACAHDERGDRSVDPLDEAPARLDALAALEAETWGAFLMTFLTADLHGRFDSGQLDGQQRALLGLMAPVTALAAGSQAVAVAAGAVDWVGRDGRAGPAGLDHLLREALGLATNEGPGHVLALDTARPDAIHDGLAALMGRMSACLRGLEEPRLVAAGRQSVGALERAALWLESGKDRAVLLAGARRLALTLARGLQLALLCEHAQWMLERDDDRRGYAAALRYSRLPVDLVHEVDPELDRVLLAGSAATG